MKQGADGIPVTEICPRVGISQATYCNRKKKYDGMLKRLEQLEDENGKLRKLVAYLSWDKEIMQDVIHRKLLGLMTLILPD